MLPVQRRSEEEPFKCPIMLMQLKEVRQRHPAVGGRHDSEHEACDEEWFPSRVQQSVCQSPSQSLPLPGPGLHLGPAAGARVPSTETIQGEAELQDVDRLKHGS